MKGYILYTTRRSEIEPIVAKSPNFHELINCVCLVAAGTFDRLD